MTDKQFDITTCFVAILSLVALGAAIGTSAGKIATPSETLGVSAEQYQKAADVIPEEPPREVPEEEPIAFTQPPWKTENNMVFYARPVVVEYVSQNEEIKIYVSKGATIPVLFVKQANQNDNGHWEIDPTKSTKKQRDAWDRLCEEFRDGSRPNTNSS